MNKETLVSKLVLPVINLIVLPATLALDEYTLGVDRDFWIYAAEYLGVQVGAIMLIHVLTNRK